MYLNFFIWYTEQSMPEQTQEQEIQPSTGVKKEKKGEAMPQYPETRIPRSTVATERETTKAEWDLKQIKGLREQLEVIQTKKQRQPPQAFKIAQRYHSSPQPMFGESVGTSQSFLEDQKRYGTTKAFFRLVNRTGIMAETGDTEIFRKEISDYEVAFKITIRGAAVVTLSAPYMLAQAFRIKHPLVKKILRVFNPYPRLFTKEARARYTPPPEFTSGTFDRQDRLIKE